MLQRTFVTNLRRLAGHVDRCVWTWEYDMEDREMLMSLFTDLTRLYRCREEVSVFVMMEELGKE